MSTDFEYALTQLADAGKTIRSINLSNLSDLARGQTDAFRDTWAGLSPARRTELVTAMVEQAEKNIHLNFHAILRGLLADDDPQVRKIAVEGLWEDERPSLVAPLIAMMAEDSAPEVRAVAALSLGRFVLLGALGEIDPELADEAARALRAAWSRAHEPVDVRRRALEGLAYSEGPDIPTLIETAYYDEDEAMQQSAVHAMGLTCDPRWTRYVLSELRNVSAPIRFEACASAGELHLAPAVRPLVELMDDPDSSVREAAAIALGKIGGREAQRALRAATRVDDARLAEAAEEALEELAFNSEGAEDAPLIEYPPGPRAADEEDDWSDDLEFEAYDADDDDLDNGLEPGWEDEEEDELDWDDEDDAGGDKDEEYDDLDDTES
jgi:HEAT repeat protein